MSTETKFTKGDWAMLPLENDKEYIRIRGSVLGGRYKVANVIDLKEHHNEEYKWCKLDREESLANAHLIAAAPKMYEILKMLLDGDSINDFTIDIEVAKLLAQARGE